MTSLDAPEAAGLRERKKVKARADIAEAALSLFADRGFDDVSIDEIAAAAGVSRRTFFRYFESKEDALLADYPVLTEVFNEALADIRDEDLVQGVMRALHRMADAYEERRTAVLVRKEAWSRTPATSDRSFRMVYQWEQALSEFVGERLGTHSHDLRARVVAHVGVGIFQAAAEHWVYEGGTGDLHVAIDGAFVIAADALRATLAEPAPAGRSSR